MFILWQILIFLLVFDPVFVELHLQVTRFKILSFLKYSFFLFLHHGDSSNQIVGELLAALRFRFCLDFDLVAIQVIILAIHDVLDVAGQGQAVIGIHAQHLEKLL